MSWLKSMFGKPAQTAVTVIIRKGTSEQIIKGQAGDNLMDLTNKIVNSNANIYGLCDKQLACTTCSVHVRNYYDKLPPPKDEEIDVLFTLKGYRDGVRLMRCRQTRMACQIKLAPQLDGMIVEIPEKLS